MIGGGGGGEDFFKRPFPAPGFEGVEAFTERFGVWTGRFAAGFFLSDRELLELGRAFVAFVFFILFILLILLRVPLRMADASCGGLTAVRG